MRRDSWVNNIEKIKQRLHSWLCNVNLDSFLTIREWLIHGMCSPSVIAFVLVLLFITGPPTHSVGASIVFARCRLSSSVVCYTPRQRTVTHQGAARDGGPVVVRPVRVTP